METIVAEPAPPPNPTRQVPKGPASWAIAHTPRDVLGSARGRYAIDPSNRPEGANYVETFWLPILGPSAYLALVLLERTPAGTEVTTDQLGGALGLAGWKARKSVERLTAFHCIADRDGVLDVPTTLNPLWRRLVDKLPPPLPELHAYWVGTGQP